MKKALIIANMLFASATVFGMEYNSKLQNIGEYEATTVKKFLHKVVEGKILENESLKLMREANSLSELSDMHDREKVIEEDRDVFLEKEKDRAKEFYKSKLEGDEDLKNFACIMVDKTKDHRQYSQYEGMNSFGLRGKLSGKDKIVWGTIFGTSNESNRKKLENMYQSNLNKMSEDFQIPVEVEKDTYIIIIHEVGHSLFYFNGIRNLSKNKKCQNNNLESVSVYFEVLAADPIQKGLKLKSMIRILLDYLRGYHHRKLGFLELPSKFYKKGYRDGKTGSFSPLNCLLTDIYSTALYNAFKLSDRISAGEISVLEGMEEAMYGEIPALTPDQLGELIDRMAA